MADRHVVFKQCLKETADRHGVSVTFMAKVHADQAGSSCHVHLSLWRDGANAFAGDDELGPGAVLRTSSAGSSAGCWPHVPDVMVLLAPTVNSYKRFVDGSWAPTRIAWSYDNRTAGFRVVGAGPEPAHRVPHPRRRLQPLPRAGRAARGRSRRHRPAASSRPRPSTATSTRPRRPAARAPHARATPPTLFAASPFAKQAFGQDVVEHYAHFFRTEQAAFEAAVTDWERRRYFERI